MPRFALRTTFYALVSLGLVLVAAACDGDGDDGSHGDAGQDGCLDPLPLDCRPSFEPASYAAIFENVLRPSCGSSASGTQCHSSAGMQADLVLQDREAAYDSLLDANDGRPRIVPGKPECSMLVQRIEASDRRLRMPLNSDPLDEGLRCAIRQWIANGAEP